MTYNKNINKYRYLLPNLLTTVSLLFGFYAIILSIKNDFDNAIMLVFFAIICDILDGRVARITGTESVFGMEYDSIVDMVSFGLAPALIVYNWGLFSINKLLAFKSR